MTNDKIIECVVQITVSKLSDTNTSPSKEGGAKVADFMQAIYDKLSELNTSNTP